MAAIISNQQQPHFYQAFNEREPVRTELEEYKIMNQFLSDCGEEPFEFNLFYDYLPTEIQELVISYQPITQGVTYKWKDEKYTVIYCDEGMFYGLVASRVVGYYKEGDNGVRLAYCRGDPDRCSTWDEANDSYGIRYVGDYENPVSSLSITHFKLPLPEKKGHFKIIQGKHATEPSTRGLHYLNLYRTLSGYSMKQLKQLCKDYKVKRYTTFSKHSHLVWLILMSGKV